MRSKDHITGSHNLEAFLVEDLTVSEELSRLEFAVEYSTFLVELNDGRTAWMPVVRLNGTVVWKARFVTEQPAEYLHISPQDWAKAEERMDREYFSNHIRRALTTAVDFIIKEAKMFSCLTETKIAEAFKEKWLKEIQKRVKLEARHRLGMDDGEGNKIPRTRRLNLDLEYQGLLKLCQKIKKHHDSEFEKFKQSRSRGGFNMTQWAATWLPYAKQMYPTLSDDLLKLFSDQDSYESLPSKIAYKYLAKDTGYSSADYIEKLVKKLRRDRRD